MAEVFAVNVPISEPMKCNVPESFVALSVIFKTRSYFKLLKLNHLSKTTIGSVGFLLCQR